MDDHCILPIQMWKPFLIAVMWEATLSDEDILEGFLEYVHDYKGAVIQNGLENANNGKKSTRSFGSSCAIACFAILTCRSEMNVSMVGPCFNR